MDIIRETNSIKTEGRNELSSFRYYSYDDNDLKQYADETESLSTNFIRRIYETLNNNTVRVWDNHLSPEAVRHHQGKLYVDRKGSKIIYRFNPGENMAKYMNESVDPCNDFYEYACGKWSEYYPIPKDRSGFDTFELIRENVDYYLRELLEETENQTNPSSPLKDILKRVKDKTEQYELYNPTGHKRLSLYDRILLRSNNTVKLDPILKTKSMYKSCMNEEVINKRGIKPLLDLLTELRYWPVLQHEWDEDNFDLIWLLGQLRLYNNDILIGEWVAPDMNLNEYVIMIKQTTLGLPRKDYYIEKEFRKYIQAYSEYMLEIIIELGAHPDQAQIDVEDILDFEIELAKIIPNSEDCQSYTGKSYIRSNLREFEGMIPEVDWTRYFSIILEKDIRSIPLNLTIITYCLNYVKDLVTLVEETPPRKTEVSKLILLSRALHFIANISRFHDIVYGREKNPPRWRVCVGQTNSHLNVALGHLFVKKHFNEKSKNDTLVMTRAIQESFKEILAESQWLEWETKKLAIGKIDSMQLKIGYPDLILDRDLLTAQYYDVLINPDLYFENCLNLLQVKLINLGLPPFKWQIFTFKHTFRKEHLKLGKVVNKNVWSTAPTVVNAYYSRHKNQIIFPAAILQPPFYHQYFPRAVNYGGIGMTIGHEISHAFDNRGRLFDNEGNMRWWWTKNDTEKFNKISKCLIDQYNSFTLPELNINLDGASTQTENIADNSAIKQAFNAYNKWLQENDDEDLPFVNVGGIQLFFVSFAQVWCGHTKPEAIKSRIKVSVHPPGKFRVLGTLRNFPEFARVFNCDEGSPMNPVQKCKIW
ncbi:zinc metalloprotease family m13 neprilysin-related [Holotrichia oblita]|uniref:Zinc metalloprotease family m13 neprilysin-related n=1 Tax=Holotrichia oblita TaxID=644536 RepID=A0ACB9SFQ4_HOLOL|nr:zinc metalloprotease family m13 neprilysin-related [Holotrichia oblita]